MNLWVVLKKSCYGDGFACCDQSVFDFACVEQDLVIDLDDGHVHVFVFSPVKHRVRRVLYSGDNREPVNHHNNGIQLFGMAGNVASRDDIVLVECDACAVYFCDFMLFSFGEHSGRQDADYENDCVFHGVRALLDIRADELDTTVLRTPFRGFIRGNRLGASLTIRLNAT